MSREYIDLTRVVDCEPLKRDVIKLFDDFDIVDEFIRRSDDSMIVALLDALSIRQIEYIKNYLNEYDFNELGD